MAEHFDQDQIVSYEELLISNSIQIDAVKQLMILNITFNIDRRITSTS